MIEEGLPEGKYRLEIYECIKGVIKRDLTEAEHKYLSHILKCYANTARENKIIINKSTPIEHKWTCNECGNLTVMSKKIPGSMKPEAMEKRSKMNKEKLDKQKNDIKS